MGTTLNLVRLLNCFSQVKIFLRILEKIFFVNFNTFATGSAPARDRLIDLTLEGHGLAVSVFDKKLRFYCFIMQTISYLQSKHILNYCISLS